MDRLKQTTPQKYRCPLQKVSTRTTQSLIKTNNNKPPTKPKDNSNIKSMTPKDLPITPDCKKSIKSTVQSRTTTTNNFRSPNAVRKVAPLQSSKQNNQRLKNNVSATRTSRRTRGERKKMIQVMESKTIDNKDIQNINHMINHPDNHQSYTNELMRYTVTQELQETE